jgi:hypothetical protein
MEQDLTPCKISGQSFVVLKCNPLFIPEYKHRMKVAHAAFLAYGRFDIQSWT